jgi:DNA mismatch endonuclease (patch repair protein)
VHGCFWHRHKGCKRCTTPKTNMEYWLSKFERNIERDKKNTNLLQLLGWNVIIVWECEVSNPQILNSLVKQLKGI